LNNIKLNTLRFVKAITLAKIISTLIIIILAPLIKYLFTGNMYIDGLNLGINIVVGIIVFYVRISINNILTSSLEKRYINVSLK